MEAYTRTGARIVLALIFICFISYCRAQNGPVIRCGGFIQASPALVESDLAVDYSPISISIITSTGVIKETTECAPNGYYLLPIYESGDFRIIVEGPEGWNFQPESVPITTDNGECNNGERVNFEITGFSITGSILSPSCEGGVSMNGVVVTLLRDGKNVDRFHFQRGDGPNYSFKNVLPGQYEISASHPSWTFSKDSTRAIVAWGSVHAENLEISGYDISGKVLSSEGDSMKNVDLNLYSSQSGSQAIQTVQSDSEGKFRVTNVECGVYELIPTFKGEHTTYDLAPSKATIQVKGDSVSIDEAFRVVGFSANGRVVNQNNVGIAGVQVLLNREVQTTTDQQGNFRLEKLESGEYDVEFRLPHHSFPMLSSIKITPNQATIAPVKLSGVDICGAAVIDSAKITKQRTIQLQDLQGNEIASTLSNAQGEYCFQSVSPQGEYRIVPTVHSSEAAALLFEPESIQVSVNNQPLYNQNFSQSKVSVGGTVACLQKPCSSSIVIQLTSPDDTTLHISTSVDPATGRFEMKGIYPGQYQISVEESSWCWEKTHHTISVQGNPIEDISFVQSGYKAIIHSSHQVEIKYSNKQANSHEVIQAKVGKNELCVVQEGDYEFVPDSCFKFNKDKIQWNTNNPSEIKFSVTHYPIRGSITAPSTTNPDDLSVIVKSISGTERTLPVSKADNGIFTYHYWSSLGDQIDITPHSTGDLLFYPASLKVNVEDPNSCPNEVDAFSARPGLFIEGKIEPVPIAGVEITVKQKTGEVMVKVKSNEEGLYRAGPLYDHLQYSLEAHLDGYYFTSCENGFKAVELSQIKITAVDQYGEKIPGVLLSLTGDAAFYRDSDTNELGEGYFDELFPGTYYLRCLLKEYSFKPTNIPIDLQEGIEHKLTVNGTRVAYSAFGSVKSLSGEAERNVIVFAKSDLGDYEETQTDSKGNFRLRGLKPSVQYSFQVKTTDRIERASPSVIQKEIPTEDILDVDFIAFRDSNRVDICGSVETEDEFLDSLSVELYVHNKKQNQQELLKTFSLDTFRTFSFPNLPLEEYTLKLISSLNQNIYEYKVTPVDIDADRMRKEGKIGNGVIFVPFVFRASPKIQTTEIHANVSFYPLLVLSVLFFIFWYRSHIREYYHAARAPQKQTREPSWIPHHVANHGKPSQTQKKKKKKN